MRGPGFELQIAGCKFQVPSARVRFVPTTNRNLARVWASEYVGFPPTPALSLRERENRPQSVGESEIILSSPERAAPNESPITSLPQITLHN